MRKTLLTTASLGALVALMPAIASAQDSTVLVDGNVVFNSSISDPFSQRDNEIDNDSYDGSSGVHQAQQNNGSLNAIQIGTDVMVNIDVADGDDINSNVTVSGDLYQNGTVYQGPADANSSYDPDRDNDIDGSFDDAEGLYSVQQNNGDTNVMGIGNSVVAAIESDDIAGVNQTAEVLGWDVNDNTVSWIEEGGRTVAVDYGDVVRSNDIEHSFRDFSGVASVQQNNGSYNLMGIANSVVGIDDAQVDSLVQNAFSHGGADFSNQSTNGQIDGVFTEDYGSWRDNNIHGSFGGASGMLTVQQNNGNANVMSVANAVAGVAHDLAGAGDVTQNVFSGGSVTDVQTYNVIGQYNPLRVNLIEYSANEAEGILNVQQNNGDANSISQSNAVAASTDNIGNLTQNVEANGVVSNFSNQVESLIDEGSERDNTIDGSFEGFDGIANVQQNNGDFNVMGSSIAVAASLDIGPGQQGNPNGPFGQTIQNVSTNGLIQDVESAVDQQVGHRRYSVGDRSNTIEDSFEDGFDGIASVQQNNGSANAILSSIGVQAAYGTDVDSDLEPIQQNVIAEGQVTTLNQNGNDDWYESRHSDRDNTIADSFESRYHDAGVVNIQQNNGDANVLGSAIAVFASLDSEDVDGGNPAIDTDTLGTVDNNDLSDPWGKGDAAGDFGSDRDNDIEDDSFDGFGGIASVQQNNGNANVLGSAIAVNVSLSPAQGPTDGAIELTTDATGLVEYNQVRISPSAERDNNIDASFDDFAGVGSVQQNNGDANVMGSAISVAVHEDNGGPGFGPVVSTTTLSGTVAHNTVTVECGCGGPTYSNTIAGSFENAAGISSVQQNNGSANVIGSAISVTVNGNLSDL